MKPNSTKTTAQLKALQTQAQALSQTLSKEVVVVTKGEQHIRVMPGRAYELSIEDGKDFDLIAKKVSDDLEVLLPNGTTIVFDRYFEVCTSDLSCLVSLPSEGGIYHVIEGSSVTLADGSQIIHFYGDESALSAIATHQSALFAESFNDVYLLTGMFSSLSIGSGEALGSLAGAGGGVSSLEGVLQMVASAGKFIEDNGGFIELYKYINGELVLFKSARLDSSGEYDFSIGDYKGIIVAKLIDKNGDEADFRDEATGVDTDISATLLAVIDTSKGGNIGVNITPLTTIAALRMGLTTSGGLPTGVTLDASTVNNTNKGVAKAFGLGNDVDGNPADVVTTKVQTVTTQDGETSTSNAYGNALAALSGVNSSKNEGNMAATIEQFEEKLTGTGADLKLTETGQQNLLDGASKAETSNSKIDVDSGLAAAIKSTDAIDTSTEITITLGFEDTGTSATDGIVQAVDADGNPTAATAGSGRIRINVVGVESNWVYSIDAGANWSTGTDTGFDLAENATAYNKADIMVRNGTGNLPGSIDGTEKTLDSNGTIFVDGEVPNGATSTALSLSNTSVIDVTEIATGNTWQYSTKNGADGTWKVGVGSSFSLAANVVYAANQIHVKKIDAAGNESTVLKNATEITGSSLALSLNSDTGNDTSDGKTKDATINVITGSDVTWEFTINGSIDWATGGTGNGSFELTGSNPHTVGDIQVKIADQDDSNAVTLSHYGVTSIDVSTATATATLTLASAGDTGAADNSITSNKVINVTGGGTWEYSTDGGENWIKGSGASFELSSQSYVQGQVQVKQVNEYGNYSQPTLLGAITIDYVAPSFTSSTTATTIDENSGTTQTIYTVAATDSGNGTNGNITYTLGTTGGDESAFSINNSGVVTLTANPDAEVKANYSFEVVATDDAGNETKQTISLTINDLDEIAPDAVDLDPGGAIGATSAVTANKADIAGGIAFDADIAAPTATDIAQIKMVLGGKQTGDKLVLDTAQLINANFSGTHTVDGVGIDYSYVTSSNTLTISKTGSGAFSPANVKAIVEAIKLQNIESAPADGARTATFTYIDASSNPGTSATATMTVVTTAPTITSVTDNHSVVNVSGVDAEVNGAYILVAGPSNLTLSADFDPAASNGAIDTDKPVYSYLNSTTSETWYLWARTGSGYHISQLNSTTKWFWESVANPADFATDPTAVASWMQVSGDAGAFTSGPTLVTTASLASSGAVIYTVTFSHGVTSSFTLNDVVLVDASGEVIDTKNWTIGTLTEFSGSSGIQWTVSVTPPSGANAIDVTVARLKIEKTGLTDIYGNDPFDINHTQDLADAQSFDTTPPSAPTLTLTDNNAIVGNDNVINIAESASGFSITGTSTGLAIGSEVSIILNTQTYTTTVTDASGNWNVNIPSTGTSVLTEGTTYAVTVNANDGHGNPATQLSQDITVDKSAPVSTVVIDEVITGLPTITGQTSANITVEIKLDTDNDNSYDDATYTVTSDASGNWTLNLATITPDSDSSPISYSDITASQLGVQVNITDAAGNMTTRTETATKQASSYSISDSRVIEGTTGTKTMTFMVIREGDLSAAGTVDYEVDTTLSLAKSGGTANGIDDDYSGNAIGTATFEAGESFKEITFTVKGDYYKEVNQNIIVNLTNPTEGTISKATGIGEIAEVDVTQLAVAYSLKDVNSDLATNAIRVRRSSDDTELDIDFDKYGNLDTQALLAFVGTGTGDTGYVSVWYDQTGNGQDMTQTVGTQQGVIVSDGIVQTISNGQATISFNRGLNGGYDDFMEVTGTGGGTVTNLEIYVTYEFNITRNGTLFNLGTASGKGRIIAHTPWGDGNTYWDAGEATNNGRLDANNILQGNQVLQLVFTANYNHTGTGTPSENNVDAKQGIFVDGDNKAADGTLKGSSLALGNAWTLMSFGYGYKVYQSGEVSDFLVHASNTEAVAPTALLGSANNDVFTYAGESTLVTLDGKLRYDVVKLSNASGINLDTTLVSLINIELINMQNGEANMLTINNTQLDTNVSILSVLMDTGDSIIYEDTTLAYDASAQELVVFGSAGANDTINMSSFNELVYGRGGNDTFVYKSWSDAAANSSADSIADFTIGTGANKDTLNLKDLLTDYNAADLADFINLTASGDNTVINVDKNGAVGGAFSEDISITLTGVTNANLLTMASDGNLVLE
ncbi:glycosyl hydrolase, BNR repeat-containing protein [Abyssogena phaseoliformis symbiont OG214]|uniref:cadherin domain-containing protein n=1 Tax=Abyssogena phaseoliformis symbiont TaxID=596095 RepID=UPI0019167B98|nr:cadherin domain-containing protein [Abyssogena phaseoliformis symbiont]BBB22254.1 glycosyl hydrolase, BNR repeat-containing protein [Abyssogena phaseoliformis symbiont OG214]